MPGAFGGVYAVQGIRYILGAFRVHIGCKPIWLGALRDSYRLYRVHLGGAQVVLRVHLGCIQRAFEVR